MMIKLADCAVQHSLITFRLWDLRRLGSLRTHAVQIFLRMQNLLSSLRRAPEDLREPCPAQLFKNRVLKQHAARVRKRERFAEVKRRVLKHRKLRPWRQRRTRRRLQDHVGYLRL